jgi:hypothetical protein
MSRPQRILNPAEEKALFLIPCDAGFGETVSKLEGEARNLLSRGAATRT